MLLDVNLSGDLSSAAAEAADAELAGYEMAWAGERGHDPFLWALLAAGATSRITVATGIAVAFGRSPLTVASAAADISELSGGRFTLGLGTQTRAHIQRRYSMPWSAPAKRMREYITAVRAFWKCWTDGSRLDFNGEFYQHTLMPSAFRPGPLTCGIPPVFLAAVGPRLCAVAGEVADGLWAHAFTTPRYLEAVTIPQLAAGAAAAGRRRDEIQIAGTIFAVTGHDDQAMEAAAAAVRREIALYASTPDYRAVLDLDGLGGLQDELLAIPAGERWRQLARLIDDAVLEKFAIVGRPEDLAARATARFAGLLDRATFYMPYETDALTRDVLRSAVTRGVIAPDVI